MNDMTSSSACQVCRGIDFRPHLRVAEANFTDRIPSFDIVRCETCGFCRMAPFPTTEDLDELYVRKGLFSNIGKNPYRRSLLFPLLEPIYRRYGDGRRFIIRNCLALLGRRNGLRILDIGCSTGSPIEAFLEILPDCDIQGIDVDPGAREKAAEHLRERIIVGNLLESEIEGPFDLITMEMVIEHLPDPAVFMARCSELLAPGGVMMVSTPNIDSRPARDAGSDWWLINGQGAPVGHVYWFNPSSMTRMAEKNGFRVGRMRSRGNLIPYLPRWLFYSIRTLLGVDPHSGRLIRWYPIRIMWALVINGWLSELLGKGEYIYTFLEKREERCGIVVRASEP